MEKIKKQFKDTIENLGYYLYELTYKKEGNDFVLRVLIENDKFINIDDCIIVSKALSAQLDIDDPIDEPYSLEVTSSGAEHELRNEAEIKRSVNKSVFLKTIEQTIEGKLIKYSNGILTVKQKNGKPVEVNDIDVSFIRLAINL